MRNGLGDYNALMDHPRSATDWNTKKIHKFCLVIKKGTCSPLSRFLACKNG
jgi:hypothetical protein